ncbi:MAG TPA: efflux RND transporter periplasmic adaptor subunit [Cyclobacteriaceae bacterium]|nr:efflux RND transporter periplasmic adaptor subunit [Cyclobacteriaceae bacterium]HNP06353.1 efflux RND transporter periplasmic adaptor subunit [Cyclobacteriaceae bacterium]HRK55033.1 efflux RND transporter periplasmic adaptor subunit [Cyclobacteriaceae bacterium]
MELKSYTLLLAGLTLLGACSNGENEFDATGNFEADEVIVSSEAAGKILELNIDEGQTLKKGEMIGYVDTLQLHLKKRQLQSSVNAVLARQPNVAKQLATVQEQIETTKREKARFENLLKADAATQKQVDDLTSQLALLQKQYAALQSSLGTTTQSLKSETVPLSIQIEQIEDQIQKSIITNPIAGTVLTKYAEESEVTGPGKALYKIADLSSITLRAYISGNQLSVIKLGQKVKVLVDDLETESRSYEGEITWIADKAEFTPKTIQTKEERANLVYALKVKVKNDGFLKIGMYGELIF